MASGDQVRPTCGECAFFDEKSSNSCHVEPGQWKSVVSTDVACSGFLALWHLEFNLAHNKKQIEQAMRGGGQIAQPQMPPSLLGRLRK